MNWLENIYEKLWINISLDGKMADGVYRMTLNEKIPLSLNVVPDIPSGKVFSDSGRTITIKKFEKNLDDRTLIVEFEILNSGQAVEVQGANWWVFGVFTIVGLALTAFVVTKVEKLLDKSSVNLALIVVSIIALFVVWKIFVKK